MKYLVKKSVLLLLVVLAFVRVTTVMTMVRLFSRIHIHSH